MTKQTERARARVEFRPTQAVKATLQRLADADGRSVNNYLSRLVVQADQLSASGQEGTQS